ncbi:MAG: tetratricopeptide repeat protein [Alphaproteobacteria bacterium]|nr:tetratricopeptide repeat protein [Alphaproteobacteria bacterium]
MASKDSRDVPVSSASRAALDHYETALDLLNGYFLDPIAAIDQALAADPSFVMGHCFKAGVMTTMAEKGAEPMLREAVEAAEALAAGANDRERGHIAAARAWLDGDFARSNALYGAILIDHPRDLLAAQLAHLGDFYLGQSTLLRDRMARLLPDWDESVPGFGYVLGMHAFGLEETQLYRRAEDTGRRALALGPRDPWAVHAVTHVMEMEGRVADGIDWLATREADWATDNMFAYHNWWHRALYHLDLGEIDRVLALYDTRIRPQPTAVVLETIDASALLWRLHLRDIGVGGRWREVADTWEPMAEDGYYAFNDVHAMMAFVGDGRSKAADRLLATLARRAEGTNTNAMMTREVGLPVATALASFGKGDWSRAVELLMPVRANAHRFGGSHAQRDLLSLTLIEAALRGGRHRLARALLAERTDLKPASPFNWEWAARAVRLLGDHRGAAGALDRATTARRAQGR